MAELNIPDQLFGKAEQPEIDTFMNNLAKECGGSWEPTSDGYKLTGIHAVTADDLSDCIADMINDEVDPGKE